MEQLHALSSWYLEQLERHPLLTKSLTASAITGASNVVAQCLGSARRADDGDVVGGDCDQRRGVTSSSSSSPSSSPSSSSSSARVNKVELVKYLLFGLLWVGPSSHFWQNALERLVPRRVRESKASWALRKMLCDQLCFGPVGNVVFLSFIGRVIQGLSVGRTVAKVRGEYVATQVRGWLVWPVASVLNQYYMPIELRVGFLNVVAFFWSLFMMKSSAATKGGKGKQA